MTEALQTQWLLAPIFGLFTGMLITWSGLTPANLIVRMARGDYRLLWPTISIILICLTGLQSLCAAGLLDCNASEHAKPVFYWTGMIGGSFIFGAGLAVARTDIMTAGLRIVREHVASITAMTIIIITSVSAERGVLSFVVDLMLDSAVYDMSAFGLEAFTISGILQHVFELPMQRIALFSAAIVGGFGLLLALIMGDMWRRPAMLFSAIIVGAALPLLWGITVAPASLPYMLIEPATAFLSLAGLEVGPITPIIGFIFAFYLGGIIMTSVPSIHPLPQTANPPRLIFGCIMMGLGAVLAGGDMIAHSMIGIPTLAVTSIVCIPAMIISATIASRLLDGAARL